MLASNWHEENDDNFFYALDFRTKDTRNRARTEKKLQSYFFQSRDYEVIIYYLEAYLIHTNFAKQ